MAKATKLDQEIGEKIELYRKIRRKTRHWLAEKLNLSYQQIQNYETGRHRVAASCLHTIAKILKTPIIEFFPSKKSED